MKVKNLEISNILSIESLSLSFDNDGLILVEGWNHDTQRANGAGKTAIFNCLSFALYDRIPRKITATDILRRGSKAGYVKCTVVCGEDEWTVERHRPKNVKFYRNGHEQTITQEEFECALRLSYAQFVLTVYSVQGNGGESRFLSESDSDKKTFLLKLLNIDEFSSCKRIVDDNIRVITSDISTFDSKNQSILSKIEAYKESIGENYDADAILNGIENAKRELIALSNVQKPDLSKYQKIEDNLRQKLNEVSAAEQKRIIETQLYKKHLAELKSLSEDQVCFECGTVLNTEEHKAIHAKNQETMQWSVDNLKNSIDESDKIIAQKQSLNQLAVQLRDKKNKDSTEYHSATLRINELNSFVKGQEAKKDLLSKIDLLTDSYEQIKTARDAKATELEMYKTLANIYSPTGAQAYVLDSVIDSFNEVVQKYIDILWPNASYVLTSFRENAKGDITSRFSEILTMNGSEVSIGSLSGGEEKALSLCVDFAMLEILETQFGINVNPIILDEPFDGLDSVGREIVIELLDKLSKDRLIFVIDHTSEAKSLFSKVIRIEKKNDISYLTN